MSTDNQAKQPILTYSRVALGYPGRVVLREISLTVNKGEFVGIIGPNGSGKSTMLKGLLGLLPVLQGEIIFSGIDQQRIKQFRSKIGYVPQKNKSETNFPAKVREVVLMGLYSQIGWFKRPQKNHRDQVERCLALVNMTDFAERSFSELSGGQQQRVIIARALIANPDLLVLDEPTAAIDITAQHAILELLERLNREQGITILMVTHDINEVVHFCDKVLLLNGRMIDFGSPAVVLTLENLVPVYGERVFVYQHLDHPHILVGDFNR